MMSIYKSNNDKWIVVAGHGHNNNNNTIDVHNKNETDKLN